MRQDRAAVRDDIRKNRTEHRVIRHQVGAIMLFQLHADALVYFHRYRAFRERVIQNFGRLRSEPRFFEILGIESRAPRGTATGAMHNLSGRPVLGRGFLVATIMFVHYANIEDSQVQAPQHRGESRIVLEDVRVHIDRCKSGEPCQIDRRYRPALCAPQE